ncbi:LysR family transcriptional regulator [Novosphingobium colocasiae]
MSGRDGARSLRAVNLNLLPILRELIRHRSVTLAAEHLNLTQSGVSEALRRLRAQFDDELLVKAGRKMVPTAVALALAPRLEDILGATEDLLKPARFDPADNEREIVIATGDTVSLALAQGLIDRLARHAPRTTVHFVTVDAVTRSDLDEGKIDFLIIPRRIVPNTVFDEEGLDRFTVYWEDWVCIARKDHPRIDGVLTLELLDELPSIACRLDNQSYLHGALPGRRGARSDPGLPVHPAADDGGRLGRGGDGAAPRRQLVRGLPADRAARTADPVPPQLEVCAFWSSFHRNDPIHAWLRAELQDIVAQGRSEWLPGEGGFMPDGSGGG